MFYTASLTFKKTVMSSLPFKLTIRSIYYFIEPLNWDFTIYKNCIGITLGMYGVVTDCSSVVKETWCCPVITRLFPFSSTTKPCRITSNYTYLPLRLIIFFIINFEHWQHFVTKQKDFTHLPQHYETELCLQSLG